MGEGIVREFGMDMDTLLDLSWRTSKDLLDSTRSSAQCHMAAWMEGSLGEKWGFGSRLILLYNDVGEMLGTCAQPPPANHPVLSGRNMPRAFSGFPKAWKKPACCRHL